MTEEKRAEQGRTKSVTANLNKPLGVRGRRRSARVLVWGQWLAAKVIDDQECAANLLRVYFQDADGVAHLTWCFPDDVALC